MADTNDNDRDFGDKAESAAQEFKEDVDEMATDAKREVDSWFNKDNK